MQCFHCAVKLDGWEASDDPIVEHLAHSAACHWALSIAAGQAALRAGDEAAMLALQDPMGEELLAARRGTFGMEVLWPHEGKKGWKCKVGKMIEAGWCYDPAAASSHDEEEEQDGVTCFYCNLSLDGWEPKDDPLKEHTRRSPDCAFFALVRLLGSGGGKGKGKKGAARASTASKGSRLSTQSAVSQFSEAPSLADLGLPAEDVEMEAAGVDDSIVTTASQATTTGTGKGKKGKGGRTKAPAKGAKGRKRAGTVDSQVDIPLYPDLSLQAQSQPAEEEEFVAAEPPMVEESAPAPAKKTRRAPTRGSKAPQIDSSVIEVSSFDLAPQPATKAKRGRKAKAKAEPEPEPENAGQEDSEVSLQLQEELERSLSIDMDARFEIEEQQASQPEKPKRGVKRTSDGLKKQQQPQEESDVSATVMEFPPPPKPAAPAAKGKKGRKPSKQIEAEPEPQLTAASQADTSISDVEPSKPAKGKKAPATKAKAKGKKASSARSSRSSKATATSPEHPQPEEEEEDLARDEREIEAELERIAAQQAQIEAEQDKIAEFEASPSASKPGRKPSKQAEPKVVEAVAGSPPEQSPVLHTKPNPTPSPAGSDKENDPSQSQSSYTKPAPAQPMLSPSKVTRVPLAPGTPNRLQLSPSKRAQLSPPKKLSQLSSTMPWEGVDLDAILLASPQPTPGTLAQRLAGVASGPGALGSPEKGLSVEEWVRFQAGKAEEELRRKCEEMVGGFEREGLRALGCLGGVSVVG